MIYDMSESPPSFPIGKNSCLGLFIFVVRLKSFPWP
jgi:hypothetical protein